MSDRAGIGTVAWEPGSLFFALCLVEMRQRLCRAVGTVPEVCSEEGQSLNPNQSSLWKLRGPGLLVRPPLPVAYMG